MFLRFAVAAEPGHGGVPEYYKSYYGYNAVRTPVHANEEKANRRLVGSFYPSISYLIA